MKDTASAALPFADGSRDAIVSACGRYRYSLTRVWNPALPRIYFVMLNPSTADATQDDPTIRKCRGFASRAGAGSLKVVNLYALRSTDPNALLAAAWEDRIGPENDWHMRGAMNRAGRVVFAWGARRAVDDRRVRLAREFARELAPRTRAVNLRVEAYDVYVGRAGHGLDGHFGKPHPVGQRRHKTALIRSTGGPDDDHASTTGPC